MHRYAASGTSTVQVMVLAATAPTSAGHTGRRGMPRGRGSRSGVTGRVSGWEVVGMTGLSSLGAATVAAVDDATSRLGSRGRVRCPYLCSTSVPGSAAPWCRTDLVPQPPDDRLVLGPLLRYAGERSATIWVESRDAATVT